VDAVGFVLRPQFTVSVRLLTVTNLGKIIITTKKKKKKNEQQKIAKNENKNENKNKNKNKNNVSKSTIWTQKQQNDLQRNNLNTLPPPPAARPVRKFTPTHTRTPAFRNVCLPSRPRARHAHATRTPRARATRTPRTRHAAHAAAGVLLQHTHAARCTLHAARARARHATRTWGRRGAGACAGIRGHASTRAPPCAPGRWWSRS
jgi:hypothetical protein